MPDEAGKLQRRLSDTAGLLAQVHDDRGSEAAALLMVAELTPSSRSWPGGTSNGRPTRLGGPGGSSYAMVQDRQEARRVRSPTAACSWSSRAATAWARPPRSTCSAAGWPSAARRSCAPSSRATPRRRGDPQPGARPGDRRDLAPGRGPALRRRQGPPLFAVVQPALAARRGGGLRPLRRLDAGLPGRGPGAGAGEVEQIARWATEDLRPAPDGGAGRSSRVTRVHTISDKDRVEAAGDGLPRAGPAVLPRSRRARPRPLPGAGCPRRSGRDRGRSSRAAPAAAVGAGVALGPG